jgi:hypothetical protein
VLPPAQNLDNSTAKISSGGGNNEGNCFDEFINSIKSGNFCDDKDRPIVNREGYFLEIDEKIYTFTYSKVKKLKTEFISNDGNSAKKGFCEEFEKVKSNKGIQAKACNAKCGLGETDVFDDGTKCISVSDCKTIKAKAIEITGTDTFCYENSPTTKIESMKIIATPYNDSTGVKYLIPLDWESKDDCVFAKKYLNSAIDASLISTDRKVIKCPVTEKKCVAIEKKSVCEAEYGVEPIECDKFMNSRDIKSSISLATKNAYCYKKDNEDDNFYQSISNDKYFVPVGTRMFKDAAGNFYDISNDNCTAAKKIINREKEIPLVAGCKKAIDAGEKCNADLNKAFENEVRINKAQIAVMCAKDSFIKDLDKARGNNDKVVALVNKELEIIKKEEREKEVRINKDNCASSIVELFDENNEEAQACCNKSGVLKSLEEITRSNKNTKEEISDYINKTCKQDTENECFEKLTLISNKLKLAFNYDISTTKDNARKKIVKNYLDIFKDLKVNDSCKDPACREAMHNICRNVNDCERLLEQGYRISSTNSNALYFDPDDWSKQKLWGFCQVGVPLIGESEESETTDSKLADLSAFQLDKASWLKKTDGSVNTKRLLYDGGAMVVVGALGGFLTNHFVKAKQVDKGFESVQCKVAGMPIAGFGDQVSVGRGM